jgi:hypothetical protein
MSDTPTDQAPKASEQPKPQAPAPSAPETGKRDASDSPLGEAGLKALQQERAERERLERELKPLKEQMDALRGAFGDKAADPGQNIVETLQQQMRQMQRDTLVDRVARRHGITDDGDVDFLRTSERRDDHDAARRAAEGHRNPCA